MFDRIYLINDIMIGFIICRWHRYTPLILFYSNDSVPLFANQELIALIIMFLFVLFEVVFNLVTSMARGFGVVIIGYRRYHFELSSNFFIFR